MSRNHQEIQETLELIYKLLKGESLGKKRSQSGDRDRHLKKSDKLTPSPTPQRSHSAPGQANTDNSAYNESSSPDGTQIHNYLNQLGNILSSEESSQPSTDNQAQERSDPIPDLWQELTETNITEAAPQFADDLFPQSQSSDVRESVKTSQESKDLETAGILEELLEQFSLDPMDPKAIEFEELLQQLAIDETDPRTVKELDQLLSRLRERSVPENSTKSLAEELELDELLEEAGDRLSQPTNLEKPGEEAGDRLSQPTNLEKPGEEAGDRLSQPTNLEKPGEEAGDRLSQPTNLEKPGEEAENKTDLSLPLLSKISRKSPEKTAKKSPKNGLFFLVFTLALLGVILLGWFIYQYLKTTEIEKKVTKALDSYPGIAFYRIEVDLRGKVLLLSGKLPHQHLRDRAAEIAGSTVPDLVVNNKIIVVDRPADLVQVSAEVEQIVRILNQIDGINISAKFEGGQVILEGTSIQYITIKNITRIFEEVPGVRQVSNQIKIQPSSIPIRIYFTQNSAKIVESDLDSKINQMKELIQSYPHLKLKIIGYSHQTESSQENLELQRAQAVETLLEDRGIDRRRIETVSGKGSPPDIASNQERWLSRCVVFEIIQSDLEHSPE